jgi:lipopolysaccharide transport system ATP-binding protein
MKEIAIRARGLAKVYTIGAPQPKYRTLRDTLTNALMAPARAAKSLSGNKRNGNRKEEAFWALKDVSFDIMRGEVVGVIGRNGAGKSTLLKVLSRITEPTAGFAEIHGTVGSLLEVGSGFHPELTGRENIYLNGAILGMRKAEIERKFDEIVAFSEIEKFLDTPVKYYSSGMYVRLAFAVAAHLEPGILIVDEVLAVGDFAFQRKCLGKMQSVAGFGRTVIFVSHNMGAVRTLCQRCIFLEEGKVLADGPSDQVVECYIDQTDQEVRTNRPRRIEADRGGGYVLHHGEQCGEVTVFCGDSITLEFDIEAPAALTQTDSGAGITISGKGGGPLISMSSIVQGSPIPAGVSRVWRVRCNLGRLPLNVGTYFCSVYFGGSKEAGSLPNLLAQLRFGS